MANTIHANASQVFNRHYDSMMASLVRRKEVAKAANDFQLVKLLKQEEQQVAFQASKRNEPRANAWLNAFRQSVAALFGSSELQVHQFANGTDRWWYTFDPRTGRCVYADSEAELRLWIEENYQGK